MPTTTKTTFLYTSSHCVHHGIIHNGQPLEFLELDLFQQIYIDPPKLSKKKKRMKSNKSHLSGMVGKVLVGIIK